MGLPVDGEVRHILSLFRVCLATSHRDGLDHSPPPHDVDHADVSPAGLHPPPLKPEPVRSEEGLCWRTPHEVEQKAHSGSLLLALSLRV